MPRPTAVLHIGVEKTGTTYLQSFLKLNARALAERGIGYPEFLNRRPSESNHHALAAYAVDAAPEQDIHRRHAVTAENQEDFRAGLRDRMLAEVDGLPHERWIFSSEHLSSRALSPAAVDRVVGLVDDAGLEPKVLVFLRPQEDMIESTFSTAVISGSTEPFVLERQAARRARYDFRDLLLRWEAAVGRDAIRVHPYVAGSDSASVAATVCAELGIGLDGLELPERRANTSLSYVQAELLRRFTAATRDRPGAAALVDRAALVSALRAVGGAPLRLSAEERARVREEYAESNAWVAEHYGVELSYTEARGGGERPEVFSGDDFAAFCDALAQSMRPRRRGRRPAKAAAHEPAPAARRPRRWPWRRRDLAQG